jgi:hypothetical protein
MGGEGGGGGAPACGTELSQQANTVLLCLSATIPVAQGAHTLHAVLLNASGLPSTLVAHASFLARTAVPIAEALARPQALLLLEAPAARACAGGGGEEGIRTATSECDALLQLAHELRLAGEWHTAARLLAQVVQESIFIF